MNLSILDKLGLTDKEKHIYLSLIQSNVQTIKHISDLTSINRSTVYRHLESLEKKGLIEWVIDERGKKAKASSLSSLTVLLNDKKSQLHEVEETLPQFISQLKLIKPIMKFATQVRYYHGEQGMKQMIWNTLTTKGIAHSYAALKRREFVDPDFEDKFEEEWVQRGLRDKTITNEDRRDYIQQKLVPSYRKTIDIRIIPAKKFYISNDITIYNDTMAIISLEKNNLVGVEIENAEIVKTQQSLFQIVWATASPLKNA